MEIWKPVVGYEDHYSVSSLGRVRRELSVTCGKAGKILKATKDTYACVCLSKNGIVRKVNIHTLVAEAFLGAPPKGCIVNHKDFDKQNPSLDNIEYCTQSQNVQHAYDANRRDCRGSGNGKAKLSDDRVRDIRATYSGEKGQVAQMAVQHGVSPATIYGIVKHRTWKHV